METPAKTVLNGTHMPPTGVHRWPKIKREISSHTAAMRKIKCKKLVTRARVKLTAGQQRIHCFLFTGVSCNCHRSFENVFLHFRRNALKAFTAYTMVLAMFVRLFETKSADRISREMFYPESPYFTRTSSPTDSTDPLDMTSLAASVPVRS